MPKPKPMTPEERKDGTCCACFYDGVKETPCPKREDRTHCEHWWEGGADARMALRPATKKPKAGKVKRAAKK